MLDYLLTNIKNTAKETQKPKVQENVISSAGEPEHF